MSRKTIDVRSVIEKINERLRDNITSLDYRWGIISIAESVLFTTGNYTGFRYLLQNEIPAGQLPGVHYIGDMPHPDIELRFHNTDSTRRAYYI